MSPQRRSLYFVGPRADGVVHPEVQAIVEASMAAGLDDIVIAGLLADWAGQPCSTRTVKRVRHALGTLRAPSPGPPVHEAAVRRLHKEGLSTRAIANRIGCTYRTAQEHLYRMGLRANRRYTRNKEVQ